MATQDGIAGKYFDRSNETNCTKSNSHGLKGDKCDRSEQCDPDSNPKMACLNYTLLD